MPKYPCDKNKKLELKYQNIEIKMFKLQYQNVRDGILESKNGNGK